MIKKVLIANRGEIAVRIIRACREMGIETVAVYSEADREALHTQLADEAICIGPPPAKESYLDMERIISATIVSGADAIHPGFGFLSENSKFARLCAQCNIIFIGPGADIIQALGNKSEARATMEAAGVPVIPGSKKPLADALEGRRIAEMVGYPVIVKAALGGGGKGMRVAEGPEEFEHAFQTASKEALAAFGDGTMYLEHFVQHPKHIEFQILADKYGNVIQLGERDCSIQRNHQKMIEESPCAVISPKLRAKMGEAAVRAAKAAHYENAGTIEFLLEKTGKFYFMEMNTRIQVEHPVTEWVTGIDLIKEQIRIADGHRLSYAQEDVQIKGHAIECRINAENPVRGFRPCPGTITDIYLPGGKGVRIDSAIYSGYTVPPYYDNMLAKLIVFAKSRAEAIMKMRSVLGEVIIEGIDTNVDYQYEILNHPDYQTGDFDIEFIADKEQELLHAVNVGVER
ncbi:acetyl-CoA carboxylase biotin carboxylase subunit [Roseburia hominis]